MGDRDANTVGLNAQKEAWSLLTQAPNYTGDAQTLKARADAESPLAPV
ncbi:MAG: hypothetical protein ACXWCQ_30810 [Burkholderiales bacterium]